jgi:hypothetical protein
MMRVLLIGVVLLAAAASAPPRPFKPGKPVSSKGTTMNQEPTDSAANLLRLPDDEYFTLSENRRMEIADAFSALALGDPESDTSKAHPRLALGGPRRIDPTVQDRVPVLLGAFQTGLRAWSVNLPPNLRIFVKNASTGELLQAAPLASTRRGLVPQPSGAGTPPEGAQAAVTTTSMTMLNLNDRLAGKLVSGHFFATAVAYDLRSNTIPIHIDGPAPAAPGAAVQRTYVVSELTHDARIDPEIAVPDHGSAKAGFHIRVARQLHEDDGILRSPERKPFLPAHVVLVGLDKPALVIPASPLVEPVAEPNGKQAFGAVFAIELGGKKGSPVAPGNYQVYLDLGSTFLGPYPLTVGE